MMDVRLSHNSLINILHRFILPWPSITGSQEASNAITANGLTSNQDLIGLTDKDVDNIMKVAAYGGPVSCSEETNSVGILGKPLTQTGRIDWASACLLKKYQKYFPN